MNFLHHLLCEGASAPPVDHHAESQKATQPVSEPVLPPMRSRGKFEQRTPIEHRVAQTTTIRLKYPDRVPLVIEKCPFSFLPSLKRQKFLIPCDLTTRALRPVIAAKLVVRPSTDIQENIALFCNGAPVPEIVLGRTFFEENKHEDGFLYIFYCSKQEAADRLSELNFQIKASLREVFSALKQLKIEDKTTRRAVPQQHQQPARDPLADIDLLLKNFSEQFPENKSSKEWLSEFATKLPALLNKCPGQYQLDVQQRLEAMVRCLPPAGAPEEAIRQACESMLTLLVSAESVIRFEEFESAAQNEAPEELCADAAPPRTDKLAFAAWLKRMKQAREQASEMALATCRAQYNEIVLSRKNEAEFCEKHLDSFSSDPLTLLAQQAEEVSTWHGRLRDATARVTERKEKFEEDFRAQTEDARKQAGDLRDRIAGTTREIETKCEVVLQLLQEINCGLVKKNADTALLERVSNELESASSTANATRQLFGEAEQRCGAATKALTECNCAITAAETLLRATSDQLRQQFSLRKSKLDSMERRLLQGMFDVFVKQHLAFEKSKSALQRLIAERQAQREQLESSRQLQEEATQEEDGEDAILVMVEGLRFLESKITELDQYIAAKEAERKTIEDRQLLLRAEHEELFSRMEELGLPNKLPVVRDSTERTNSESSLYSSVMTDTRDEDLRRHRDMFEEVQGQLKRMGRNLFDTPPASPPLPPVPLGNFLRLPACDMGTNTSPRPTELPEEVKVPEETPEPVPEPPCPSVACDIPFTAVEPHQPSPLPVAEILRIPDRSFGPNVPSTAPSVPLPPKVSAVHFAENVPIPPSPASSRSSRRRASRSRVPPTSEGVVQTDFAEDDSGEDSFSEFNGTDEEFEEIFSSFMARPATEAEWLNVSNE